MNGARGHAIEQSVSISCLLANLLYRSGLFSQLKNTSKLVQQASSENGPNYEEILCLSVAGDVRKGLLSRGNLICLAVFATVTC